MKQHNDISNYVNRTIVLWSGVFSFARSHAVAWTNRRFLASLLPFPVHHVISSRDAGTSYVILPTPHMLKAVIFGCLTTKRQQHQRAANLQRLPFSSHQSLYSSAGPTKYYFSYHTHVRQICHQPALQYAELIKDYHPFTRGYIRSLMTAVCRHMYSSDCTINLLVVMCFVGHFYIIYTNTRSPRCGVTKTWAHKPHVLDTVWI